MSPVERRPIVSPSARSDLDAIADHIALDSVQNALRWSLRLDRFLLRLAESPGMGTARPELDSRLGAGARSVPFGNYVMYFRAVAGGVEVARVLHGMRDPTRAFGEA